MYFDLYNEDCLDVLPKLPASSFDLIIADLPYGITNVSWDSEIDLDILWKEYKRLLKPKGSILLFGVGIFTAKLIMSNASWYKQTLVWDKNKCGSPGLAKIRPMQVTEDIVVFSRGRTTYNPQMQAGEPYKRKSSNPEGYVAKKNTHGYGLKPVKEIINTGTRYPKNIIKIPVDYSAQQRVHPTQKPVALFEYLIRTYSNPGGKVLDNCFGSCPSGCACVPTNRNFVGIEKGKDEFSIGLERINRALKEKYAEV